MLSRHVDKNKYGGHTWHIKLDSLFHIFVHGTDNSSYVVDFKEFKWVSYKTLFSFVSNENLETTIIKSFDRVFDYYNNNEYLWTEMQKNSKLNQVIELLRLSKESK